MGSLRIVAIILIIAGVLALVYGGFSFVTETHRADLGALSLSVDEKQYINVPAWAGVGAILVGGILLVVGRKS
ncbi:hypothetical protein [Nitrosomonas halophila]|uniref:Uncharacterized protein n=1 Tax=Nitrosomonas halophila TaxID=44576 RepID=A0A1H3JSZ8_9PROT|nr:hypothetical protein [Nitrosomonas halophila]SDY43067.1 hypothetical protein SAMN05421881_103517 [Nitrosomonas halophila]